MIDVLEKMAAGGQLTQEQADRAKENVAEFMKAAEADPAFLEEAVEKVGFFGSAKPEWGRAATQIGGAIGLAALGNVAGDVYKDIKNSITKAKGYKTMLSENPDLGKMDAKRTQAVYNTLHTLNPTYADDPLVSGQFVRNSMEMERMDLSGLKNIVDANKSIAQSAGGLSASDFMGGIRGPFSFSDPKKGE